MNRVDRLTDFLPFGVRTVEEPAEIVRPNLSVARHRLAIEADVVGQRAEEHMGQLVFLGDQSQLVFMPQDLGPAVGALERVAHRSMPPVGHGLSGSWLVHPARLRHAQIAPGFVPGHHMKQRYLRG